MQTRLRRNFVGHTRTNSPASYRKRYLAAWLGNSQHHIVAAAEKMQLHLQTSFVSSTNFDHQQRLSSDGEFQNTAHRHLNLMLQ